MTEYHFHSKTLNITVKWKEESTLYLLLTLRNGHEI